MAVMEHETQAALTKIREEIRLVWAIGEVLQLFEGMSGPVNLEPDCLGVVGRLIADRMAGALEAVVEIRASLDAEG